MVCAEVSKRSDNSKPVHNQTIQNSMLTKEIHDQGKNKTAVYIIVHIIWTMNIINLVKVINMYISADSAFCWAFSLSSMLRHSLNTFLRELKSRCASNRDQEKIEEADKYLNRADFHKQLRNGFGNDLFHCSSFINHKL